MGKKAQNYNIYEPLKNCFFWIEKCILQKTKVVPKTLSYCKTDEKIKFSKYIIFGGIYGVPKWAKKLKMT